MITGYIPQSYQNSKSKKRDEDEGKNYIERKSDRDGQWVRKEADRNHIHYQSIRESAQQLP